MLLMDQAGWHMTAQLAVPGNISIVPLPAKCPELNPQENVWQFLRDNWLASRVFAACEEIVGHCCDAWKKLVDQSAIAMANSYPVALLNQGQPLPASPRESRSSSLGTSMCDKVAESCCFAFGGY
ncbi:hypothetical protein ABIC65_003198 [Sphingomonas trueperi]